MVHPAGRAPLEVCEQGTREGVFPAHRRPEPLSSAQPGPERDAPIRIRSSRDTHALRRAWVPTHLHAPRVPDLQLPRFPRGD